MPRPWPAPARTVLLTLHVLSSVGWLGGVAAFLVVAVLALGAPPDALPGMYAAMEAVGLLLLVPLSLASFVTGVLQAVGTRWGLVRHYWVAVKLVLTTASTAVLLLYTGTFVLLAEAAAAPTGAVVLPSTSPVLHAAAALAVLCLATVLSVVKPRGITPHGWRVQRRNPREAAAGVSA